MTEPGIVSDFLDLFDKRKHDLRIFIEGVVAFIGQHPDLTTSAHPVVHSYKSRVKDRDHLRTKILRKLSEGVDLTTDNFFWKITDLAGVRILHLYQQEFRHIDQVIRQKVNEGDWALGEKAKAYTWDPETVEFFRSFDLEVSEKATSYTSVHYLVRPRADSPICCEIQVRTLFEEIWGGGRSPNQLSSADRYHRLSRADQGALEDHRSWQSLT